MDTKQKFLLVGAILTAVGGALTTFGASMADSSSSSPNGNGNKGPNYFGKKPSFADSQRAKTAKIVNETLAKAKKSA